MSTTPLTLPEHAWRRPVGYARKFAAVMSILFGMFITCGGLVGPERLPALEGWIQLIRCSLWTVAGVALWIGNHALLRRVVALHLIVMGVASLGPAFWGPSRSLSLMRLSFSLVWLSLGMGVWGAREWARRGCVIVGLSLGLFEMLAVSIAAEGWSPRIATFIVTGPMFAGPLLAVALYGELRSTRLHFSDVREARARARAVPR